MPGLGQGPRQGGQGEGHGEGAGSVGRGHTAPRPLHTSSTSLLHAHLCPSAVWLAVAQGSWQPPQPGGGL